MSAITDEQTFSAASYALSIPETDGLRAAKIRVRFFGVIDLDRTNLEHLEVRRGADARRAPVRAVVVGGVSGKGFTRRRGPDAEDVVGYYASVRIDDVEIGDAVETFIRARGRRALRPGGTRRRSRPRELSADRGAGLDAGSLELEVPLSTAARLSNAGLVITRCFR